TASGTVGFTVEIASNGAQQERGLMYRRHLAQDHGMVFLFDRPQHIDMWMKNTYIPLDMVFIDKENKVIRIAKNTQPESTRTITGGNNVKAVLEIKAGAADYFRIAAGDKVILP